MNVTMTRNTMRMPIHLLGSEVCTYPSNNQQTNCVALYIQYSNHKHNSKVSKFVTTTMTKFIITKLLADKNK